MADDIKLRVGVEGLNDIAKVVTETEKLEKKVKLLAASFERGNLTNRAYFKGLNQQVVALRKLGYDYKTAQSYVNGLAKSTREAILVQDQFAAAAQASQKTMHRNGVVMQQVGYQVGDFLVQVQSGTNAFVAFGQQATQLVGVMGMLNPKLIALSAGLGIIIPLVTAVGAALLRSRESADEFESATFDINKAAKTSAEEIAKYREEIALLTSEFKTLGEVGIDLQIKEITNQISELEGRKAQLTQAAMAGFGASGGAFSQQDLQAMINEGLKEQTASLEDQVRIKRQQLDQLVLERESAERVRELTSGTNELVQEGARAQLEKNRQLRAQAIEALRLQREVSNWASTNTYEKRQQASASMDLLQSAIDIYEKEKGIREELGDAAVNALKLAGVDLEGPIDRAAVRAAELARQMNLSFANAVAFITAMDAAQANVEARINAQAELSSETSGTGSFVPVTLSRGQIQSALERDATNRERAARAGRGGGGGSDKTPYIEQLKAEAQYKSDIVGLSDQEARRREILLELAKREETATDAEIQQILNLEAATTKATEALKQAERQQEFYKDTLMDGMESIVDGSKSVNEAFRDMLRNMLLDIYRQKVMEPIAQAGSSFLSSLFMAKGGASNKGVQMFAAGGVVSSPTMFGHSGGLGMMGEAGPEAIMPLKRGPDGKLGVAGSQGNVVVNQSFNFSANGDDSVKRIIAQAAPQIAQMTQKQIMDSRRRGGQMKSVFS